LQNIFISIITQNLNNINMLCTIVEMVVIIICELQYLRWHSARKRDEYKCNIGQKAPVPEREDGTMPCGLRNRSLVHHPCAHHHTYLTSIVRSGISLRVADF